MRTFEPKRSKFTVDMCDKILDVAVSGGHVAQMCAAIGIRSFETFYRWLEIYPEFKEAYDEAKLLSQAYYENLCHEVACGHKSGASASILALTMYSKFPNEYKKSTTTEIQVNTVKSLDDKSLDEQIIRLQAKLGQPESEEK